ELFSRTVTAKTPIRRILMLGSRILPIVEFRDRRAQFSTRWMPRPAKSYGTAATKSRRGLTGAGLRWPMGGCTLERLTATCTASAKSSADFLVCVAAVVLMIGALSAAAQPTVADRRIQSLEREVAEQKRLLRDWGRLTQYGSDNTVLR